MEFLESAWLIQKLERSGQSPSDKLLALFSCVEEWIGAPSIREQFKRDFNLTQPIIYDCPNLTKHLVRLSSDARVADPHIFVTQLLVLLQGAIAEELRTPGSSPFLAARDASAAILKAAQPLSTFAKYKWLASGVTVTLALTVGVAGYLKSGKDVIPADRVPHSILTLSQPRQLSPDVIEQVLALQTQIEAGNCPSPQLFSMPQDQMSTYMDLVHFRESMHPAEDAKKLREFLTWYSNSRSWECYYRPANGHTAVSWRKS